jgi:hypothetical protein
MGEMWETCNSTQQEMPPMLKERTPPQYTLLAGIVRGGENKSNTRNSQHITRAG